MRFKEVKLLINEQNLKEQDLFEINMSPSNLEKLAGSIDARAGMEFEMIVPNVQGDPDDFQSEPDYDRDERCRSIEDACQFFYDGDSNSRRDIDRLREKMQEDYLEWLDGKIESEWDDRGEEYILEWVKNNVDEDEWNPDELEGDARNEALEEFSANVHADPMGDYYQQARDEFREEHQDDYDEGDWLDEEDLDRMSDVENAYNINWPYYTEPGDEYGQAEISDVAQDFENHVGRDTYASDSYHSSHTLRPSIERQRYIVEPDSSLDGDNTGDQGLEFVSPPLTIPEMFSDLDKVAKWARDFGCYTNESTGLHINVSVPNFALQNLDYVKLALLLGDKYVLDLFNRAGNTYCKSALDEIKKRIKQNPQDAEKLLSTTKNGLEKIASKIIHSGTTSKYTSINTKDKYIEFRSPGGDWLDPTIFKQIKPTLLRFVVALDAACDPEKYRDEYLKKLYTLIKPDTQKDTLSYFAQYVAGQLPKAALKSFVRQAQLERKMKKEPAKADGGPTLNGRPSDPDGRYVIVPEQDRQSVAYRFQAAGPDDAAIVLRQWRQAHPDQIWVTLRDDNGVLGQPEGTATPRFGLWDFGEGGFINSRGQVGQGGRLLGGDSEQAAREAGERSGLASRIDTGEVVIRRIPQQPQSAAATSENQGNWGIWIRLNDRFARVPGQTDNSALQRFPSREAAEQYLEQYRRENIGARHDLEVREIAPAGGYRNLPNQTDYENRLGWGSQTNDANYEVVQRNTMQPVFLFIANTFAEAARKYTQWLDIAGFPHDTEDFGWRQRPIAPIAGSTIDLQRQRAARSQSSTGVDTSVPYEIYNRNTGEVVDSFELRNDDEARIRLDDFRNFGAGQANPDNFGVRRGPGVRAPAPASDNVFGIGGQSTNRTDGRVINYDNIADVQPNVAQNFPAQGREFDGWKVLLPSGEEVFRFGIGDSQAEANRIAAEWLRNNGMGVSGEGYEVVPVWREA